MPLSKYAVTLLSFLFVAIGMQAQQASFALSDTMPCTNDTLTLSDASTGSISDWRWIIERGSQQDTLTGQGPHDIVPGPGMQIRVRLRVADTAGLDSSFQDINLRPAPFANIFVFGQNPFCANDGVLLDGGFHDRYRWSTGDTTSSLSVRSSGQFWVQVTSANGCSAADTVQTIAIPGPPVNITANGPLEFCEGDSVVLNGGSHVDYFWNGALGGADFTVRKAGQVILVATDSTGCSSADTVTVIARPTPMPRLNSAIFCEGDSIMLTLPGFRSVLWSMGDTGAVLTLLESDTLTAVVVDSFGCQGMLDTTYIRELPLPQPTIGLVSGIPQTQRYASYQWNWLDTSNMSLIPIAGASGQSLAGINYENDPNNTGFLVIEVNDGLCTGLSEPFDLTTVGITSYASDFSVYPQPAPGAFRMELPPSFSAGFQLSIQDLQGRQVKDYGQLQQADNQFIVDDIPAGMYLLLIEQGAKRWSQKIIFSKKE